MYVLEKKSTIFFVHFIIKPEIDDKMLLVIITMKTIKGSKNKKKIIVSFDYLPKCYNWD